MDKFGEGLRALLQDKPVSGAGYTRTAAVAADLPQSVNPHLAVRTSPWHTVSLRTCTKISLISFVVGVVVGYSLKRRLRRWVAKMLKRYSDD